MKFLIFALVVVFSLVEAQDQKCNCDEKTKNAFKAAKNCMREDELEEALEDDKEMKIQIIVPEEKSIDENDKNDKHILIMNPKDETKEKETSEKRRKRRQAKQEKMKKCADEHFGEIKCYLDIKESCKKEDNENKCMRDKLKKEIQHCKEKKSQSD